MPNIKMKSISVGDLGTIVKQMITGALEDTEQIAKLHRAIYEELYFEKMMEFERKTVDKNSSKSSSEKTLKTEPSQNIDDCNELEKFTKKESKADCTRKQSEHFILSGQGDNCASQITVKESAEMMINENEGYQIQTQKPEEATITDINKQSARLLDKDNPQRNEDAFEIWRKEKTRAMKMTLKDERVRRQEELAAKQEEIERKRAIHEAYLRSKKLHDRQRKQEETQRRMRENFLRMQEEESVRLIANEEAFKSWLKRKNSESIQRYCQSQKYQPQTGKTRYSSDVEFECWLDQLDSVLHQKYLRERRHRVRSFYCQPIYYGTAALCKQ